MEPRRSLTASLRNATCITRQTPTALEASSTSRSKEVMSTITWTMKRMAMMKRTSNQQSTRMSRQPILIPLRHPRPTPDEEMQTWWKTSLHHFWSLSRSSSSTTTSRMWACVALMTTITKMINHHLIARASTLSPALTMLADIRKTMKPIWRLRSRARILVDLKTPRQMTTLFLTSLHKLVQVGINMKETF